MTLTAFRFPKTSLYLPDKPEWKHRLEIDADLDHLFNALANLTFGGLPGGSNTHVQYNNGGVFGGDSGFRYISGTSVNIAQNIKLILDDGGGGADTYLMYNSSNSYLEIYVDGELRAQL